MAGRALRACMAGAGALGPTASACGGRRVRRVWLWVLARLRCLVDVAGPETEQCGVQGLGFSLGFLVPAGLERKPTRIVLNLVAIVTAALELVSSLPGIRRGTRLGS